MGQQQITYPRDWQNEQNVADLKSPRPSSTEKMSFSKSN